MLLRQKYVNIILIKVSIDGWWLNKMCNNLWKYWVIALVIILSACSQTEYAAGKSSYHINTNKTIANSVKKPITTHKAQEDVFSEKQPNAIPVLSVTKSVKSGTKSLGSIYLPTGFSDDQEDLILEIQKENKTYKAATPFLFNSTYLNSQLALSAYSYKSFMAGIEFTIPFGNTK